MMQAKVSEIFFSVQGEGQYVGRAQVFVRFFGCHLGCRMCDTPQGRKLSYRPKTYSSQALVKKIFRFSHVRCVSLTGGEPLEQKDFLKEFLPLLKRKRVSVYLETNGTLPGALKSIIRYVDIVAMDMKLPSTTGQRAFWKEHAEFLRIAARKDVFVKVVVGCRTRIKDVLRAAKLASQINRDIVFILQPQDGRRLSASIRHCLKAQEKSSQLLSDVRVVAQMHKFLKVR